MTAPNRWNYLELHSSVGPRHEAWIAKVPNMALRTIWNQISALVE